MNTKTIIFIILILVVGGALYSTFTGSEEVAKSGSEGLYQVPDLTFKDYSGVEVSLSDFRGTPIIVNAWASWCPFCVDELPDFVTVQKEFEGEVLFIAINREESLEKARGFTDSIGTTDDLIYLLDAEDSFYESIAGFAMPETIFVNEDGGVMVHKRGVMDLDEIRSKTKDLIGI